MPEELESIESTIDSDVKTLGEEPEKSEEEELGKPPDLGEADKGEGEGEEAGKEGEEGLEKKEGEEEGEEEEHGIVGRPSFKEIKAKYPNFFKDFPDFKDTVFRERG